MKDKQIFETLLADKKRFICSRPTLRGTERYCVYTPAMTPIVIVTKSEMSKMYDLFIQKGKRYYLSLQAVRSLHGNNAYKIIYKQSKKQTNA